MPSLPSLFPKAKPATPAREVGALFARRRRPSWGGLAGSVAAHGLIVALALLLSRHEAEELASKREQTRSDTTRQQVIPFYVPPPPPPKPVPPPAPKPPPPPPVQRTPPPTPPPPPQVRPPDARQPVPEPEANAPPDAKRSKGSAEPDEKATEAQKAPDRATDAAAPKPSDYSTAPTMESEARRIFGNKPASPTPGAGPRDVRPLENELPDNPNKCTPKPRNPADSLQPPQFGVAVGRIFRQDNGQPLAGAHLQMLGTPYTAFTDDNGEYHFRFDMSLVDFCRTQYVRVTAPGYESRLLVLMVGPNVRSEDVALRRKR